MINVNLEEVSFDGLVSHLQQAEKCPIKVRNRGYFMEIEVGRTLESLASLSNLNTVCEWAKVHRCTVSVMCRDNNLFFGIYSE